MNRMKRLHFWIIFLSLACIGTTTHSQWTVQSPIPNSASYRSVSFVNPRCGWAVGARVIVHTTDGGLHWVNQSFDHTGEIPLIGNILSSVAFTDSINGWITSTSSGKTPCCLLHTTDGGSSWNVQRYLNDGWEQRVFFADALHGWILGPGLDSLIRTTDGGVHWNSVATGLAGPHDSFRSMQFIDGLNGWAIAGALYSHLMKTTTGGTSWSEVFQAAILNDVFFSDALHGWVTESGTSSGPACLHYTTDGGSIWAQMSIGTTFGNIYFVDAVNGWSLVGGNICHSTDAGTTWQPQTTGGDAPSSFSFLDAQTGWAVGGNGQILHTTDGGNSWESQRQGWTTTFQQILFADDRHGWIIGDTTMLRTSDGGVSWGSHHLSVSGSMDFVDSLRGWCVGWPGQILRTDDAGDHWVQQCTTANPLTTVDFINPLTGWAAGISSDLWRTTDGGVHWTLLHADCDLYVSSLDFINSEEGWAGTDYAVSHTTDGGSTWTRQSQGWTGHVQFVDGSHGFAFDNYHVYRTTDGGATWTQARLPSVFQDECPVTGISFKDPYEGIIAGEYALVYTDDGGVHTGIECAPTPSGGMWSVCMLPNGDILGVDGSCIVRRTGAFPPTSVERQMGKFSPAQFILEQNYPNPFNPSTTIRFELPHAAHVTLRVYNTLGQNVAVLVDENKPAGIYAVQFDGRGLASGVYLCLMRAGERVLSRTMLLLR